MIGAAALFDLKMEQLPQSVQDSIRKCSSDRLSEYLIRAGLNKENVEQMSRDELLAARAQFELERADVKTSFEVENKLALQAEYFEFEKYKFEAELALQREKLEAETRLQREKLEVELQIKRLELEQQNLRQAEESRRHESVAARVKKFGDAVRNAITRQSNDPLETVTFFRNAEALFATLDVPTELQGVIIRPFLNEKAKLLVARLDQQQAADYDAIKNLILKENQLTPATYRDKFNTLKKTDSETYVMFASRLFAMLDSYLESRAVASFDDLRELFLCDRLKQTLNFDLLKHVLSVESTAPSGWLKSKALTELVDNFVANRIGDRPRYSTPGSANFSAGHVSQGVSATQADRSNKDPNVGQQQTGAAINTPTKTPTGDKRPRPCFLCGSLTHLKAQCPRNRGGATSTGPGPGRHGLPKQVNNCSVGRPEVTPGIAETAQNCGVGGAPLPEILPGAPERGGREQVLLGEGCVNDVCIENEEMNCEIANLHYVDVNVASHAGFNAVTVSCLEDSGSQVAVANKALIDKLEGISVVGSIKIRGVIGEPITCDLVKLHLSLPETDEQSMHSKRTMSVVCAVSDVANNELLLPITVTAKLHDLTASSLRPSAVNVVTRSGIDTLHADVAVDKDSEPPTTTPNETNEQIGSDKVADFVTDLFCSGNEQKTARETLRAEQQSDPTLLKCWKLHEKGKGNFMVIEGVLMHKDKLLGREMQQLVLPHPRRKQVIELGHGALGAHMAWKNTAIRIRYNFWWPTMRADIIDWVSRCQICQQKARITCWDRVPIQPIPRADEPFTHLFFDVGGPLSSEKLPYNYFLVVCDSCSRFPVAYALRSVNSRTIADCLISLWQFVGTPSWITCDNASYNVSGLMQELMRRMGCCPRLITPGHSQADGLAERLVGTTKCLIAKLAAQYPKQWHKHLGYVMWALREVPNETTHLPPALLAFGRIPTGPLAILKETWCGEREFPTGLGKTPIEYLKELQESLHVAKQYADEYSKQAQQAYSDRYSKRARDKHFEVNDQVLILRPDQTQSRVFSKWIGPGQVIAVKSPHSYIVRVGAADYHVHANDLRGYKIQADEVNYDSGALPVSEGPIELQPLEDGDLETGIEELFETPLGVATCTVIRNTDADFGSVRTVNLQSDVVKLPSERLELNMLQHLNSEQQQQLLNILDEYPDVFSDQPGLCTLIEHEIPVTADFTPRRLRAYKVPDRLKAEVERQLKELAENGFIEPSNSPMASPMVCVLKGPDGKDGVRITIDYRFINRHTVSDALPVPDIPEVLNKIGKAHFISVFDASQSYWQTKVKEEDRWKTAFVCNDELWQWVRTPYGGKRSGNTFCRAIQLILKPIKNFVASFVDDMAVFSDTWEDHCQHLRQFLQIIKQAGITLKLKKCRLALPEVKFCGQLVGSGTRRADPEKAAAVQNLKVPETKRNVRQIIGFFSYFREHIANFAALAKPLTDLTAKDVPNKIPWGSKEQSAFDALKAALIKATEERLYIVDLSRPRYHLLVDASDHTVAGALLQVDDKQIEYPVAFHSQKLNNTQRNYATVEKEAYAALMSLRKYRQWVFGSKITVFSDHNPLTFLTESAPKSAKLMRWALALQEFDVEFKYRAGRTHIVPDVLTRCVE